MAQVITFEDFTPIPRYDATPWTEARIEESDNATLSDTTVWTELETIALSPVDADPENPASRDFTTELASDDMDLWYRIVFVDASGDESLPTTPIQNSETSDAAAYASIPELLAILNVRNPSEAQEEKAARVLLAAAGEINRELDLDEDDTLDSGGLALCAQVNLARAAELWKEEEVQFGILGVGSEVGTTYIAADTWRKHAIKLSTLKGQWGFA